MKYLLLIYGDEQQWANMAPEAQGSEYQAYEDFGKWLTETRNVLDDFKRIYGEDPSESVGAVAISINSQNTNARAESYFGEILFRKP